MLLYENCREKWIAMYIYKKKHNKNIPPWSKKNRENDEQKTLYTNQDAGQSKFDGWSGYGKERYNTFKKQIIKAREADVDAVTEDAPVPSFLHIEREYLVAFRAKHNITCSSIEEQRRSRKPGKKAKEAEKIVECIDMDDCDL